MNAPILRNTKPRETAMNALSQFANGIDWFGLGNMVLRIFAVLLCLVVHEVSHGWAAYRLGDPTAMQNHRLSLNPLRHLDIFGTLMMLVAGFGWAKPVPIDPRYFKNPKKGMAITALAGPASNFVLALISAAAVNAVYAVILVRGETNLLLSVLQFFYLLLMLNLGLGIFNLIPFPPLDGSKVVAMFLSDELYYKWMRLERYGMLLLMAVLWFGWFDSFLITTRDALLNTMLGWTEFVYEPIFMLLR